MRNTQKGYIIPLLAIVAALAIAGCIYLYTDKKEDAPAVATTDTNTNNPTPVIPTQNTVKTPTDHNAPFISSISQSSGPVGTIIELKGVNFAGLEGDMDALIENSKGEVAFLAGIGYVPRKDNTIRVKIDANICKENNSYSGQPCKNYVSITPGKYKIYTSPWGKESNKVDFTVTLPPANEMSLTVYLQDKKVAETETCAATYPVTYQVPKTTSVADASLKILFGNELAEYGVYKSVTIEKGVAKVMLTSNMTRAGKPLSSLSSCQTQHLFAVLKDTLTQYPTIKNVELHTVQGKIEL
ncbi:MAG: hypothetical protein V4576_02630 [Patescibacteria group bacterium]